MEALYLHQFKIEDYYFFISNLEIPIKYDSWQGQYNVPQVFFTTRFQLEQYHLGLDIYCTKNKQALLQDYWKSGHKNQLIDRTL